MLAQYMNPTNKDQLPAPGVYTLSRDLKNPLADKRVRGEFGRESVWAAGTRLLVRYRRAHDRPEDHPTVILSTVNGYEHHGIRLDLYPKSEEFDGAKYVAAAKLLTEPGVLVPEPRSIQSELLLRGDGDQPLTVTSYWGGPLGRMLQFGDAAFEGYATLNPEEVEKLIKVLTAWVNVEPIDPVDDEGEAVIKRPDGTPETCGKCAAIGTNSKGPGAHSPDCHAGRKLNRDLSEARDRVIEAVREWDRIWGLPAAVSGKTSAQRDGDLMMAFDMLRQLESQRK